MPSNANQAWNPSQHEEALYREWEEAGYFRPETQVDLGQANPEKDPFVVAMPPPNVTGALHLGHAIMDAVEDFLVRYRRMQGHPTLWVPGTDHAGIATQSVVERYLENQGTSREELGREAFEEEVWAWKDEYHHRISSQQRRMGISCDWTRERFTLDPGLSRAVRSSFVRLYREGLIYRRHYLVNWSPRLQTAVSDLEVEYSEETGTLYTFRYPLEDGNEYIPVSTTRPETILGDTGLAVHPDDDRYRRFVGRNAVVPLMNRPIPVIADEAVDKDFGTGALKITPGHDHTDYEIGSRHDLPAVTVLDRHGVLNENAGRFAGLERNTGRQRVWEALEQQGLAIGTEQHLQRVPRSQRSGEIIEPRLSLQWFVSMEDMAAAASAAVRNGEIRIVPERFEAVFHNWLDNIRDWCISRQLWWGHRIPVWYGPDGHEFCAMDEGEARMQARAHYGHDTDLRQDPDVLDTWYSSGLWPFSILGWPDDTQDMRDWYPTTVLETGYDIIFFWVARMIMMGLKFTGRIPFSTVYLHGLVRAESGEKMSKSLGNAVDPLDLIAEYGADALRYSLLTGITPGNDVQLNTQRLQSNRNFGNKLWNAARFASMHLDGADLALTTPANRFQTAYAVDREQLTCLANQWIHDRCQVVAADVTRLIESWQIGEAGAILHNFVWHEFCDWYLESAKVYLQSGQAGTAAETRRTIAWSLERILRLLHPYLPFLTEAVWKQLPGMPERAVTLMMARWPDAEHARSGSVRDYALIQAIVRTVRNLRSEYRLDPGRRLEAWIVSQEDSELLTRNRDILCALARLDAGSLQVLSEPPAQSQTASATSGPVTIHLPLAGILDIPAERTRLAKDLASLEARRGQAVRMLDNPGFVAKAPAEVVQRERDKVDGLTSEIELLQTRLHALGT
jgi:valyl-tRNA synthetase